MLICGSGCGHEVGMAVVMIGGCGCGHVGGCGCDKIGECG